MNEHKMTGKTRYRFQSRLFRQPYMVLQVQMDGCFAESHGGSIEVERRTYWRDAVPTDLTADCKVEE